MGGRLKNDGNGPAETSNCLTDGNESNTTDHALLD
jgi:hypothetical protein